MAIFEHDAIVAKVTNVNIRAEKHGKEHFPAVDVTFRVMQGATGSEWDALLRDLTGWDDAEDQIAEMADTIESLPFSAAYEQHRVKLWTSTVKLATLEEAKINLFRMTLADIGITFRVQCRVDPETVGALVDLLMKDVRLETVNMQEELDLDPEDEADEEQPELIE